MSTTRRNFIKIVTQGAILASVAPSFVFADETSKNKSVLVNSKIAKVHLIFKTHLDVGFTASSLKVTKNLWDWKIPAEIGTARTLEKEGLKIVFYYGAWVIWEALQRSKGEKLRQLEKAIADDIVTWGGTPFTSNNEYYDGPLFESLLSISHRLDQRFGKKTIAGKVTDVPGQTIGVVPHLDKAGIKFLHVGMNWAATSPDVPDAFIWRHPDGSEVITMYCHSDYGSPQGVKGHDQLLGLNMKGDNMDPWTVVEVRKVVEDMKQQYPNAVVTGSTMNEYAATLDKIRDQLPVVTSEIGDTWIYGAASDPYKNSRFYEMLRLRNKWLQKGEADLKTLEKFSVNLGLIGEHTWGLDHNVYLDDETNIPNVKFNAVRHRSNYKMNETSWNEQREYIDSAIESLPGHLAKQALSACASLLPVRTDISGYSKITDLHKEIDTKFFTFKIGDNGSIISLTQKSNRRQWFDEKHALGLYQYQTFSGSDLLAYDSKYWKTPADNSFAHEYDKMGAVGRFWQPKLQNAFLISQKDGKRVFISMILDEKAVTEFGGSKELNLEFFFPNAKPEIEVKLQWFKKTASGP